MMYRVCERCGCSLDCGEKCDCETQSEHETYTSREREEKRNDCTVEREQRAKNKATSYRFGDDERELTAEEKEAYKMAGNIAEKIHYAGQAAAVALFSKMTYKEFKRAYKLPEWVKPEEYYFFSKSFYQAYCWGYEEGEKEQQFDKEERKKE